VFMLLCKFRSSVRSGSSYSSDALSVRDARGLDSGRGTSANDSVRVCKKGIVRGGDISGSSDLELRFVVAASVIWLMRFSMRDDLFRLWRDVRLSSSGFMSGGSLEIFRKMIARYIDIIKDIK
jgi:hypothetical protein